MVMVMEKEKLQVLQGLEDRVRLRKDDEISAAAPAPGVNNNFAVATPNNLIDDNQDPTMAMLYGMEQKIDSLQSRMDRRAARGGGGGLPSAAATAAPPALPPPASAPASAKHKRKRRRPRKSDAPPPRPLVDDDDTRTPPSAHKGGGDDDAGDNYETNSDVGDGAGPKKQKAGKAGSRVNWSRYVDE